MGVEGGWSGGHSEAKGEDLRGWTSDELGVYSEKRVFTRMTSQLYGGDMVGLRRLLDLFWLLRCRTPDGLITYASVSGS